MKRRVLLSIIAAAAVAVLLFGLPLAVAVGRLYRSQQVTRLERTATAAVGRVSALGFPPPNVIQLPQPGDGTHVAVYDRAGGRIGGVGPSTGGRIVASALAGRAAQGGESDQLVAAVPVLDEEQVVAATTASGPLDVVEKRTRRTWLAMAALGAAAIAGAGLVARRQARRLAAPVVQLAATATLLGEGDFGARAARSGITELDGAAAALDRTAVRLGQLVDRERAFAANASHQLRTPLTALRLTLESALENPGSDLRAAIVGAVNEADRLATTIDDLLALTHDSPRDRAPLDLGKVVQDIETRWHGPLAGQARPLRAKMGSDLPTVVMSRGALVHVLEILLDNAFRHGEGAVTVSVQKSGGGVTVDVCDEGRGIEGDPDAVFARGVGSEHGHGIGLALARSLTEAEGGQLLLRRAAPNPIFSLVLPATPADGRTERHALSRDTP
ncbi:MAG: HAMP domain-containing histidine kinase [Acidimicrobiia bacterium]|nr:HAMP domain-containing histidine kinase [Acidimicrobiia bacterium]